MPAHSFVSACCSHTIIGLYLIIVSIAPFNTSNSWRSQSILSKPNFGKFKILADKKKHIYDEDIAAIIDDSLVSDDNVIKLKSLKVFAGTGEPQKAEMTLEVYGEGKSAIETGDGPVDAIFKCIKNLYPHDVKLLLYNVHAVTEGTDAQATVSVRIEEKGKTTVGQAADTDTLVASANAYLNALNKLIIKRTKTAPDQVSSAQQ